jgi:hypothetical protein
MTMTPKVIKMIGIRQGHSELTRRVKSNQSMIFNFEVNGYKRVTRRQCTRRIRGFSMSRRLRFGQGYKVCSRTLVPSTGTRGALSSTAGTAHGGRARRARSSTGQQVRR